jgi:ectoine hydroxylase-related dioxygenase (phytanoyl-CoA dioxygenase family)
MSAQPSSHDLSPWLNSRPFADWREAFDERGYVIFPQVLAEAEIAALRNALAPHFVKNGRNDFEGLKTHRVYALLAKGRVFADLAMHPLALAFAEAELGRSCLLSACLAIRLGPGETVQPWHTDDGHIRTPDPRPVSGVSAFWAIDDTTEENGATEVLPGSHKWSAAQAPDFDQSTAFKSHAIRAIDDDPHARADAVKAVMPAGSLMIAKGGLWHRGGANRSTTERLIITPQYCAGWARPLETMLLAVPPQIAAGLPERARELLGYSILPPFMGYVDGMHPARVLEAERNLAARESD